VLALSFGEMLLSGFGLDKASQFTEPNVMLQYEQRGVWTWHIPFFYQIDIATMLITGHEEEFWTFFMEAECYNPIALSRQAIAEWTGLAKGPGGLRGILETYRAGLVNGEFACRFDTELKLTLGQVRSIANSFPTSLQCQL
jgi:hypothetical protein